MGNDNSINHLRRKSLSRAKLHQKKWVKRLEVASGSPIKFYRKQGVVFLVVDCSSSMAAGDKMEQAKRGAIGFADNAQKKGYSIGIIQFSSDAELTIGPQDNISPLQAEVCFVSA